MHADTFADFSADPTHLPQKMTQKHRRWQERHEQEMGDGAVQNASPADARAIKESAEAWAEFEWRNRATPMAGGGVLEKQFIGQGVSLEELVAAEVGGHSQLRGRSRSDVKQKYEPIEISLKKLDIRMKEVDAQYRDHAVWKDPIGLLDLDDSLLTS